MNRTLSIMGIGAVLATMLIGIAGAGTTGQNQYGSGFPIGPCGYIHGAFANTNGNFGIVGHDHVSQANTGDNNADASAYCTALNP